MCWLGNNRLVIGSQDLGVTTFAIRDHYDHKNDQTTTASIDPPSIETKSMSDVSLLSQQQSSSSMIRTESFRVTYRQINNLSPLLIPPSMMPLILAASSSDMTTTTMTSVAPNETKRSSLPLIGDTACELISTCIMFGDDSVSWNAISYLTRSLNVYDLQ
jgi:hypothetical protein